MRPVERENDEALQAAAGTGECPSHQDLAAWVSGGACPAGVLDEAAGRLAALWGLDPGAVRVTGWGGGGLVGWADGWGEFSQSAAEIRKALQVRRSRESNPLFPIIAAWQRRPRLVAQRDERKPPVLPAALAMVNEGNRRDHLFSLAAHVGADGSGGQAALPGFERPHGNTPARPWRCASSSRACWPSALRIAAARRPLRSPCASCCRSSTLALAVRPSRLSTCRDCGQPLMPPTLSGFLGVTPRRSAAACGPPSWCGIYLLPWTTCCGWR